MINVQYFIIIKIENKPQCGVFISVPVGKKDNIEPQTYDYVSYYMLPLNKYFAHPEM